MKAEWLYEQLGYINPTMQVILSGDGKTANGLYVSEKDNQVWLRQEAPSDDELFKENARWIPCPRPEE